MNGLKRNTVKLEEYNSKWAEDFENEKEKLQALLGDEVIGIYHIGSTAIPGISAKPIIDIAVHVNSFDALDRPDNKFKEQGFIYRPGHDEPGYRLYVKGGEDYRTHHIHFYEKDSTKLKKDLYFRDYLIGYPAVAKEYDELKQNLALKYPDDRKDYTGGKKEFIEQIVAQHEILK